VRAAVLEEDLAGMPRGLETTIGPRGLRLSGGQVQRTAAARMLVRQPELLVVDDVSSALDTETEAILWDRLFEARTTNGPATTALVVSHRRPALARADLVVVVDAGRIVERGTAEELLERSAIFRDLWG
jgi:ATP-binding cassette subfamily B protein